MKEKLCCVMLPAGSTVHVNGYPVELAEDVAVSTHPANVPALFADADEPQACGACPGASEVPPFDGVLSGAPFGVRRGFSGPLRAILVRRIAARTGADEADIQDAIDQVEIESDRPLLDWLRAGGFEAIIQAVLAVLKLLA